MTLQPPGQPAKKSRKPLILGVVGGVLALCCGGGAIAVAVSSNSGSKAPGAKSSPAATPATGAAQPAATTQAAAAPKVLLTLKGNGIKKSQIFTTGGEWTLAYTFDCASFGGQGNFQVTQYDGQGGMQDLLVNELAAKGNDSVPVHASPGAHYLEMNSECSWTVTATG